MSETNRPPRPGPVQYAVFTWVPEAILEEWNEWHNRVHIPHVLAAPQMKVARKFRVREVGLPGGWSPQFVTIYDVESLEAFDSYRKGPGIALREEYDAKYGEVGKVARAVWVGEITFGEPD